MHTTAALLLRALLPPCREAVEESQRPLCGLVLRHLMFELAALLREGADALVNPLIAVRLDSSSRFRARGDDAVNLILENVRPMSSSAWRRLLGDCQARRRQPVKC